MVPALKRLVSVKVYAQQVELICDVIEKLQEYVCSLTFKYTIDYNVWFRFLATRHKTIPCYANVFRSCVGNGGNAVTQDVLVNYGLLDVLIDMLQMDERGKNGVSTCIFFNVTSSVGKRSKNLHNDLL